MRAAALTTMPHFHHSNIIKQHIHFNTRQPRQQISLQQSNAVNDYIETPKFQILIEVFTVTNLLTTLIPTCQFMNCICVIALSSTMVYSSNYLM